jgi:hypothetical protein
VHDRAVDSVRGGLGVVQLPGVSLRTPTHSNEVLQTQVHQEPLFDMVSGAAALVQPQAVLSGPTGDHFPHHR